MPGPPIRKPSDHSPPAGSPRNIAGHHVLHRPLMPRHPPNAQNNKQQDTRTKQETLCRRNLTVRCSRPLYSSQPTHPHPPTTPKQAGAPDGSGNQGALPQNPDSMPPPRTRAGAPTTTHQAAAGVSPTPSITTSQPRRTHPQHQPAMTSVRHTPTQPAQTHTAQTNKQPGRGNHAQPINP